MERRSEPSFARRSEAKANLEKKAQAGFTGGRLDLLYLVVPLKWLEKG